MEEKKICCGLIGKENFFTFECMKFFMCMAISFISMAFGMYLLITDKFKTTSVSTFGVSFITNTIMFWLDSPKISSSSNRERDEV